LATPTVTLNRTNYATNPDFVNTSGSTTIRTNNATNPHAATATGWAYAPGVGEAGTTTVETGAGPDGQNGFMRRTITTVKTSGSTGWQYGGPTTSAVSGVTGDIGFCRIWMRASTPVNGVLRISFYLGSTLVNNVDASQVSIGTTWQELTASGAATGAFDNIRLWVYHTSGFIPAVGTLDATQAIIEKGYGGAYFDGGTPNTTDYTYSWTGSAGNSTSTMVGQTMWTVSVSAGTAGTAKIFQSSDVPAGQPGTKSAMALQTVANTGGSSGITVTPTTGGLAGDVLSASCWVKFNVDRSIRLLTRFRNGSTVVNSDALAATWFVPANTWTFIKTEGIVATGDYTNVQIWPWLVAPSSIILNAGDTQQVALMQIEKVGTVGTWFSGATVGILNASNYSPPAQLSYSWSGAAQASFSYEYLSVPLQDYQVQATDGTNLGARTNVGLLEVLGLRGSGQSRGQDQDRAGVDGMAPSMSLLTGRSINIKWLIADKAGLENSLPLLNRNWQNIMDPSTVIMTARDYLMQVAGGGSKAVSALRFQLPGRSVPIVAFGKPGKLDPPVNSSYQFGYLEIQSDWRVLDGKLYDDTVNTASVAMPSSTGGAKFPWTFPVNFGPSTGGVLQAVNNGLYPAPPVLKIVGPVTNPRIIAPTGQYVRVNVTLQAGDVLIIDCDSHVVRVNGANRNNALDVGSSFFTIPPGGAALSFASTDNGFVAGIASVYTLNTYSTI
jgi:hypothetical protein